MAPILEADLKPTMVDVGARNGVQKSLIPNSYAGCARFVGYEPNPQEYNKHVAKKTDAQAAGISISKFKHEKFFDCALWDENTDKPFFITAGAGACTLMGAADDTICENMWLKGENKPYSSMHTAIVDTTPVKCKRLDSLLDNNEIIDILKIDVEEVSWPCLTEPRVC